MIFIEHKELKLHYETAIIFYTSFINSYLLALLLEHGIGSIFSLLKWFLFLLFVFSSFCKFRKTLVMLHLYN